MVHTDFRLSKMGIYPTSCTHIQKEDITRDRYMGFKGQNYIYSTKTNQTRGNQK